VEQAGYWQRKRGRVFSRRKVLRGAAAAGGSLAGLALLACSTKRAVSRPSSPADAPRAGGTLNVMTAINPTTFDPQRTTSGISLDIVSYVMSRLFRFKTGLDPNAKDDSDLENDLAVAAESPDAVTWTIKLRPDAKFQNVPPVNGHPVEAEDIRASFIRALDPQNPSRTSLNMIDAAQTTTPARDTVQFKLNYPYADFRTLLASSKYSWIVPREAGAGSYDLSKQVIGSGPFLFGSYTPDVGTDFRRNPDWYSKGLPHLDAVHGAIVPNPSQAQAQFTGGNADIITDVRPNDIDAMKRSNPRAIVLTVRRRGDMLIQMPLGDPSSPFGDVRVRRALSLALDRASLGKSLWGDNTEAEYDVPSVMGKWALKTSDLDAASQQNYKFDLPQAKKLLSDAGVNLNLKLYYYEPHPLDPLMEPAAEAVANMFSALPLKITLVRADYNKDWLGGGKGARYGNIPNESMVLVGLEGFTSADDFLYGYWYSKSSTSTSRLKDPTLDAMLDKARTVVDDGERVKAYKDVQKYMVSKTYTINGFLHGSETSFVQPWLHHYVHNAMDAPKGPLMTGVWLDRGS
jgi:peptide/nickel transport system substrate-binding protein